MTISGLSVTNFNLEAPAESKIVASTTEQLSVEQYVNQYFSDVPILKEVAKCESQFRQIDTNGHTLRGSVNSFDRGVMQINELYHLDRAESLGYDLNELSGNVAYARHLFEREGLQPWSSSAPCWKKTQAYEDYVNRKSESLALK